MFFGAEFAGGSGAAVNLDAILLDDEEFSEEKLKVFWTESNGGNLFGTEFLDDAGGTENFLRGEKCVVVEDW